MYKLDLYYFDACPFCQYVLNAIDSLGLKEKVNFMDIAQNRELRENHMNKTGRSTTPCLYIDDNPMFESQDIISWLTKHQQEILN